MKNTVLSLFIITSSLLLVQCNEDAAIDQSTINSEIDQEDFLVLDLPTNNIIAYNSVTLNSKTVGSIPALENSLIDAEIRTSSNMFIDKERNQLITKGINLESGHQYILIFDYSKTQLVDSINIEFPFTYRFFYSEYERSIVSFLDEKVYIKDLSNGITNTYLAPIEDCGWAHQGIDNEANLFYNFGCNITTTFNMTSMEFNIVDNNDIVDKWSGLFSIGVNQDEDYLIGFGLYQRFFPEDPDFVGAYDSIRNELYLVKKDIINSSFDEVQVDTKYGLNNGYYDVLKEFYFLHHDENKSIMIYNKDLILINTLVLNDQYLIKQ